jgi:hypothetical protein
MNRPKSREVGFSECGLAPHGAFPHIPTEDLLPAFS